jgi:DNA adenine methylase
MKNLKPIIKWTGGKRREIKNFFQFFPDFVLNNEKYTFVEPFVGGGAVYFYLNNYKGRNIINDFDSNVINFYKEFKKKDPYFLSELKRVSSIIDHNTLEKEYYDQRNKDKNLGLKNITDTEAAIRFFIVNQLAFSRMRRFNSNGEFNVPFGHYKKLNINIINSKEHIKLLNKTKIICSDFEKVMLENDKEKTFIFLDPPYTRVFKEYSSGNEFGEEDHKRLANTIRSIKNAKIMIIIDKSDFTINLYKDLIKSSYELKYGVNIKNRFNTAVEHLIICNY